MEKNKKIFVAGLFLLFVVPILALMVKDLARSKSSSTDDVPPFEVPSDVALIEKVTDIDGKTFYFLFKDKTFLRDRLLVEVKMDGTEIIKKGSFYLTGSDFWIVEFTDTQRPPIMFKGGLFWNRELMFNLDAHTICPSDKVGTSGWSLKTKSIYIKGY